MRRDSTAGRPLRWPTSVSNALRCRFRATPTRVGRRLPPIRSASRTSRHAVYLRRDATVVHVPDDVSVHLRRDTPVQAGPRKRAGTHDSDVEMQGLRDSGSGPSRRANQAPTPVLSSRPVGRELRTRDLAVESTPDRELRTHGLIIESARGREFEKCVRRDDRTSTRRRTQAISVISTAASDLTHAASFRLS
jgi:hypothetical protein